MLVTAENQSLAAITRAAPGNRTAGFEHIRSILDRILLDLEAGVEATGGFSGDVLPTQRPLSTAIDLVIDAQPEASADAGKYAELCVFESMGGLT